MAFRLQRMIDVKKIAAIAFLLALSAPAIAQVVPLPPPQTSFSAFMESAPVLPAGDIAVGDIIPIVRGGRTYAAASNQLHGPFDSLTVTGINGSFIVDPSKQIEPAIKYLMTTTGTVVTTPSDTAAMPLVWLKTNSTLSGTGINRSIGMFEADYDDFSPTNNNDTFTGATGNCNILIAKASNSKQTSCVGVVAGARGYYSQGGVFGTERGELHAANIVVGLSNTFGTPTNYYDVVALEADVTGCTGCTMKMRAGFDSVDFGNGGSGDSEQGSVIDAAYVIASVPGTKGWRVGIELAGLPIYTGNALDPVNGVIMASSGSSPMVGKSGIDLNNTILSDFAFRAPSGTWRVTGAGVMVNTGMPTSCSGQVAGTLRNNAGVVNVCP